MFMLPQTPTATLKRSFWIAVLFSSASLLPIHAMPQIALLDDVSHCEQFKVVEGYSGYGKYVSWRDLAKQAALHKAEHLAATHVVWIRFDTIGGFNGVVQANSRCNEVTHALRK